MKKPIIVEKLVRNNNIIVLDLEEFFIKQKGIAQKYLYKINTSKQEVLDKYILQIIEELWEVENAVNKTEYLEELCDVVMYTGSLITLISDNYPTNKMYLPYVPAKSNELDLFRIVSDLISIRRFFPERKWHKNEKSLAKPKEVEAISISILLAIINRIFKTLISKSEEGSFDFIEYITNKELKILASVDPNIKVIEVDSIVYNRKYSSEMCPILIMPLFKSKYVEILPEWVDLYNNIAGVDIYYDDINTTYCHKDKNFKYNLIIFKELWGAQQCYKEKEDTFNVTYKIVKENILVNNII